MSDYTTTPNLALFKPVSGADVGNWGSHWNSNADKLDGLFPNGSTGTFLPLSGGTMTGSLNYTATGGNTSRSAQDRAADIINVLDYGAKGDGTTDDSAAFMAAFNALPASGGVIYAPGRNYVWASALTWANKGVILRGDGKGVTNITIGHTGMGLTVNQTGTNAIFNRTQLEGLTFYTSGSGGPTQGAVTINYPTGANFPASFGYPTVTMDNVAVLSSTGATSPWGNSFLTGITLWGAWQAKLTNIHVFLTPTNPGLPNSYGIGLGQCEDTRTVGLYVHYGQAGVLILDHGEGLDLVGPSFVGCDWGVAVAASATYTGNALWNLINWTDGECATYLGGMDLRATQGALVSNTHFTRFIDSGASGWTFARFNDCNWCNLCNNRVDGGLDAATATYADLTYTSWACWGNKIDNGAVSGQIGTMFKATGSPYVTQSNYVAWTDENGARRYATPVVLIGSVAFDNGISLPTNATGNSDLTGGITFAAGLGISRYNSNLDLITQSGGAFGFFVGGTQYGWWNNTGINGVAIGAGSAAGGSFTTVASSGGVNITAAATGNNDVAHGLQLGSGIGINTYGGSVNLTASAGSAIAWFAGGTQLGYLLSSGITVAGGIGIHGAGASATKPTVSGAKGGNAALSSLIATMAGYGFFIDGTTA
jgi:hypothetical protein